MNRGTKGLELWCRRQIEGYPGVEIHNMTTSWKNGMAFCALVHHFRPDLIDFDKLNKADVFFNNDLAFRLAEKHLGIPALLDAADMAKYQVPDRLSILTYLSQYYQRFASQESKIIQDKSATISSATPPPQKMAHIVGVPKREPCKQCGLPVFFAERLAVDGSFYHRKCLRCARCDSQLTPGSFYETEVDGVFCCETCPDEESKLRLGNNNVTDMTEHPSRVADEQRQSFSEKLAMFQTNGKGLLQKSLSDEEKSKSLKRLTELYSKNCTHETNDVKETINETEDVEMRKSEVHDDNDDEHSSSECSDDDDEEEVDEPPLLPTTLPPSLDSIMSTEPQSEAPKIEAPKPKLPPIPSKANVLNKIYGKMGTENRKSNIIVPRPRLQTQTSTEPSIVVNEETSQKQLDNCANEEYHSETLRTHAATANTTQPQIDNEKTVHTLENNLNTNNRLPLDALHSFTNVTKENANDNEAREQHPIANVHRVEDASDSKHIDNDDSIHINTEDDCNGKNAIQSKSLDLSMETEHAKCELNKLDDDKEEEKDDEQNEQIEQQQQTLDEQAQSICSNDFNVNNSIDTHNDKYDTNKLDDIADLRQQSSSISENDRQKMVRSRLSQFEALVQSSEQIVHHSPRLKCSSVATGDSVSTENERKKSTTSDEMANISDDASLHVMRQLNVELSPQIPANQLPSLNADDDENSVNSNSSKNAADSDQIQNTAEINDLDVKKPVPRQRATLNMCLDNDADFMTNPPTPSKRKPKSTASANKDPTIEDNLNSLDSNNTSLPEISLSSEDNEPKKSDTNYPDGLNPFGSDDDDGDEDDDHDEHKDSFVASSKQKESQNPFDSSDDEIELLKDTPKKKTINNNRISTNPFGSDSENENETDMDSLTAIRTPVPTPRKQLNGSSFQSIPDMSPRMSLTIQPKMRLRAGEDLRGSDASLASTSNYGRPSSTLNRSSQMHGSMSSLASSTPRHKKGRAPDIPKLKISMSASSSPSHSMRATPTIARKKRAAPLPPKHSNFKCETLPASHYIIAASKMDESLSSQNTVSSESVVDLETSLNIAASTESNYVSSSNDMSLSSTEPTTFMSAELSSDHQNQIQTDSVHSKAFESNGAQRKLIRVDQSLLDDMMNNSIGEMDADEKIVYRRKIIPDGMVVSPIKNDLSEMTLTDRQCEKMKENKESQNKNRQSQIGSTATVNQLDDSNQVFSPNKSSYGKWKRRKGPAPSLPIPPRKVIQMLPLQEIRHELEVIEVQQQGLEKQGIMLEKMIRERCEGTEHENQPLNECKPNSKEVEDLILQLFELVNEKNELFRRQAELMYLRRQHRLEQEQADIEYEIRVLMAQPECNKTDSDKAREEALISRLVDVVQLRNEVIESLEMDRRREAEEDQSIKEQLELHTAKRDEELCQQTPVKLSKKEKKKQKESKKLAKQKKMDADKDADESEISLSDKSMEKKKKKKKFFSTIKSGLRME